MLLPRIIVDIHAGECVTHSWRDMNANVERQAPALMTTIMLDMNERIKSVVSIG